MDDKPIKQEKDNDKDIESKNEAKNISDEQKEKI